MITNNHFITVFILSSISIHANASDNCTQSKKRLANDIISLCESYDSIHTKETYTELRRGIEETRISYYQCGKKGEYSDAAIDYMKVFIKSKYVLSEVDFYLTLREKRKDRLDLWSVEKGIFTQALAKECNQFFLEIPGFIKTNQEAQK